MRDWWGFIKKKIGYDDETGWTEKKVKEWYKKNDGQDLRILSGRNNVVVRSDTRAWEMGQNKETFREKK